MKFYMFRTVPLSINRSLFTVRSVMVYVIPVCRQLSSRTRMELCSIHCSAFGFRNLSLTKASSIKNKVILLFVIKPTRCTNFTNLFCHETLHVSDSWSVHHQEFIHCTLSNGLCHTGTVHTAFEKDQDGTEFYPGPARKLSTNLFDIYHC
jgi:hypothetical protein